MSKNYEFFKTLNLGKYSGEWVAVCKEKVVSHGKDFKKVFIITKEKYPGEIPFIARVRGEEEIFL